MTEALIAQRGRDYVLHAGALPGEPTAEWFDAGRWQRAGGVAIATSGRGAAMIVRAGGATWVVRHYRRGGLVARVVDDHYLWLGLERTRAFKEWRLLRRLRAAGLPVPEPVAAHVRRAGVVYTADLITAYLPATRKLSAFIAAREVPADAWAKIGRMLRAVHAEGVNHPDLTAHNILLDSRGDVFLVDFDNADVRAPGAWSAAGVERLKRSLLKVARETGTAFDERGWSELAAAYGER